MIVEGHERVLVQGITGKQGTYWTEHMQAYGTRVVAGVNPKKAGTRPLRRAPCSRQPAMPCARQASTSPSSSSRRSA